MNNLNPSVVWSKISYFIVHQTTLWLVATMIISAIAAYFLSKTLDHHHARAREAGLSRKIAAVYLTAAVLLWVLSSLLS